MVPALGTALSLSSRPTSRTDSPRVRVIVLSSPQRAAQLGCWHLEVKATKSGDRLAALCSAWKPGTNLLGLMTGSRFSWELGPGAWAECRCMRPWLPFLRTGWRRALRLCPPLQAQSQCWWGATGELGCVDGVRCPLRGLSLLSCQTPGSKWACCRKTDLQVLRLGF